MERIIKEVSKFQYYYEKAVSFGYSLPKALFIAESIDSGKWNMIEKIPTLEEHFVHISEKDNTKWAYSMPNYSNERQISPTKYLIQFFGMNNLEADNFLSSMNSEVVLHTSKDADTAVRVYMNHLPEEEDPRGYYDSSESTEGVDDHYSQRASVSGSCMRYPIDHFPYSVRKHGKHPISVYFGYGDIEIAWIENHRGETKSRALINLKHKKCFRIYAGTLDKHLEFIQAVKAHYGDSIRFDSFTGLDGCRIEAVHLGNDQYLMPYIDGHHQMNYDEDEECFIIDEDGELEAVNHTGGYINMKNMKCADCDCTLEEENYTNASGEYICEECSCEYSHCYHDGDTYHNDNLTYLEVYGRSVCDDCLSEYYTTCADCGEYVMNDDLETIYYKSEGRTRHKSVCNSCYNGNSDTWECHDCGDKWEGEAFEYNGNEYCPRCELNKFTECPDCNELHYTDDMIQQDGKYYCCDCFKENFKRCSKCRSWHRNDDIKELDSRFYCEECYYSMPVQLKFDLDDREDVPVMAPPESMIMIVNG